LYATSKKCEHSITADKHNSANNSIMHEQSALATLTRVTNIISICKRVALHGQRYCYTHIKQHPEDYARYSAEKHPKEHNDIHALSTLLTKLINKQGAYESIDTRTIIALLRKVIDTRKAQRNTLTQERADTLCTRIADIISAYAPDKRNEIGAKLLSIAKEYADEGV
jgi:hypothetical protein